MLRCIIWLSSVDVNIESFASGGKLNLLSSYESDMKLSVWQYILHFIQIDFQCHIFQHERVGTHITYFLCLFIVSLTSKLFVLISFSTVKFLIFIDCCLIKMLRFDILYFICFIVKDKKKDTKNIYNALLGFFMNHISEDFYHFLTLLKALKFSMKVFNEFWKALWTYLTICWNVREIKITDYTPDSVI